MMIRHHHSKQRRIHYSAPMTNFTNTPGQRSHLYEKLSISSSSILSCYMTIRSSFPTGFRKEKLTEDLVFCLPTLHMTFLDLTRLHCYK